jgi:ABC-type branched-subunit amino acid transport system ATPase component
VEAVSERLEVVEHYTLLGEHRWRVRVKGTRITLNVAAETEEEAFEKARRMLERVGLAELLKSLDRGAP